MTGVVKAKRGRKSKAELQEEFEVIKEESLEHNGYSNPKAQPRSRFKI